MARIGGAARAPLIRASERTRSIAFNCVVKFLTDGEQILALAGDFELKAGRLVFEVEDSADDDAEDKPKWESPVTRAAKYILEQPRLRRHFVTPAVAEDSASQRVVNLCRYWFKAMACQPERDGYSDKPRTARARGEHDVTIADIEWLGEILVTTTYKDDEGNERRYTGFEAMLKDLEAIKDDEQVSDAVRQSSREIYDNLTCIKATPQGSKGTLPTLGSLLSWLHDAATSIPTA